MLLLPTSFSQLTILKPFEIYEIYEKVTIKVPPFWFSIRVCKIHLREAVVCQGVRSVGCGGAGVRG